MEESEFLRKDYLLSKKNSFAKMTFFPPWDTTVMDIILLLLCLFVCMQNRTVHNCSQVHGEHRVRVSLPPASGRVREGSSSWKSHFLKPNHQPSTSD